MHARQISFALLAVVAGAGAVWLFGPAAVAQVDPAAGPGGFGGPGGLARSLGGEELIAAGGGAMPTQFVLISPDKSRVWGYSTERGEWKQATVDGPIDVGSVIVGQSVAVLAQGRKRHAFSSLKGEWDTVELTGEAPATPVVCGQQVAVVAQGRMQHAFSGVTGEWDTVELPPGSDAATAEVGTDYAQVRTATSASTFSARRGKWDTVNFGK